MKDGLESPPLIRLSPRVGPDEAGTEVVAATAGVDGVTLSGKINVLGTPTPETSVLASS